MRKIIVSTFFVLGTLFCRAQSNNDFAGEEVANRITNRLKDSLDLNQDQRKAIKQINQQLHAQKQAAMKQYAGTSQVGPAIQKIENTRDSLYKLVLPDEKFLAYKNKKATLLKAN